MKDAHKVLILNNEIVRGRLRQKKYDDVCLTSWGNLDEFINFIISFGLLTMPGQLGVCTGHSCIPYYILAMMAFIKPLFGIRFDDNIKYLSSDPHVLRSLGFNLESIKGGYGKRTKNAASAPIPPNTLRNFSA